MNQVESSSDYLSYLVRIWREGAARESSRGPGRAIWRASVVSVPSGERRGFASLDELVAFLKRHEEPELDARPGDQQAGERQGAAGRQGRNPDQMGR